MGGEIIGGAAGGCCQQNAVADQLFQARHAVNGDLEFRCLIALPQQGHFVEGEATVGLASLVGGHHLEGMDRGEFSSLEAVRQAGIAIIVHQETDGAAVHAIDRNAGGNKAVEDLQHVAITAQGHDDVGNSGIGVAVLFHQFGEGLAGLGRIRGEKGDAVEFHAGFIALTGGVFAYNEGPVVSNP